jgi:hypothetical protein
MALTYLEKMQVSQRLLDAMRLRLAGKKNSILPPDGVMCTEDPADVSLVGGLAPAPDPDYHREQAPSAMGMVLMVKPDEIGKISFSINGRFDVTHRFIPDLTTMLSKIQVGTSGDKNQQKIPDCFKRFTVSFKDLSFVLDINQLNTWNQKSFEDIFSPLNETWKQDIRIFRVCKVNDRGWANQSIPWEEDCCADNIEFAEHVSRSIFIGDEIFKHDVVIRTRLRLPPPSFNLGGVFLLEVYLQNNSETNKARAYCLNKPVLLDVIFDLNITSGVQIDVPHRLQPEDYRYQPEDSVAGYGITCAVKKINSNYFVTDSMPSFAQNKVDAPTPRDVNMPLSASFDLIKEKPIEVLDGFLGALRNYNLTWDELESSLSASTDEAEFKAVKLDRSAFECEVELIADGIDLLRKHEPLRKCFQLMNEAVGNAVKLQGKSFDGWHLFQLGFILTQVRAVFERHCLPTERHDVAKIADVLWFATGGGKTEAYLGIIAFAMFYGRTQGRIFGTTAWMRFPLRMLSAQQFQRLSYVVAQSEIIRVRENLIGHPFTLGYYTGTGTPSNISRSDVRGAAVWLPELAPDQLKKYQFISDCPYCGVSGAIGVKTAVDKSRIFHSCSNEKCWSNTSASAGNYGEGIFGEVGIYVSDEECYRYLPTVLVGTVDKLAVIAHNDRFAGYLGAFRHFCPDHGFIPTTKCKHQKIRLNIAGEYAATDCENNTRTSKVRTIQLPQMVDPGIPFLIQDELHLLRESLGNFDAHYETLLQALQKGHGGQTSKILAATATIKDFENHILHLYMMPGRRFPAPGAKKGESFYARISWDGKTPLVRRWYAGVLPLNFVRGGTERASAEVASRYLDQIDYWLEGLSKKNIEVSSEIGFPLNRFDELLLYIGKFLNTDLIYANQKRQTTVIREHLENLNAKDNQIRTHVLLDGETPLDDILGAIHCVETKLPNDPMRHIVATSVVSHGVDIAELNFMVLDGWPRSTAEYIQSSARSGRVQPGIVMSVLSTGKLFESGVFLNFVDYHFFLDKLVDSVPINRFAPNVLQRTLPGVFTAVILNWAKFQNGWGDNLNRSAGALHKALNEPSGEARRQLKLMLINSLDIPQPIQQYFDLRVLDSFKKQLEDEVNRGLHRLQNLNASSADKDLSSALESIYQFGPMRSFRDIENQVQITPLDSKSSSLIQALRR